MKRENKVAILGKVTWLYTKYQLMTKGILVFILFPLSSFLLRILMESTGRTNISSGDYLRFLFSFQGLGMLLLALVLLVILIGVDINSFVIMSALIRERKLTITARQMFFMSMKSLKNFLHPSGIFIMIYVAIALPIIGVGITISPMRDFQIPNFITDVIYKNPLYLGIYVFVLLILGYVSIKYSFVFHSILLLDKSVGEGLKYSAALMKRNFWNFVKDFMIKTVGLFLLVIGMSVLIMTGAIVYIAMFVEGILQARIGYLFFLLLGAEISTFLTLMTVPIICDRLTILFYRYHEKEGHPIRVEGMVKKVGKVEDYHGKIRFGVKIAIGFFLALLLSINFVMAIFFGIFFEDVFLTEKKIDIVAHRGGGDLAAENTVKSLEEAILEGVEWSEIDVQRTKDGYYVINHDANFLRVAGERKKPGDMKLEEIKKLRVRDLFNKTRSSYEVATLEEMLDTAKEKIGLFIELKGRSADKKMVDEIVAMVKEKDMVKETALLSLDYSLIQYAEEVYPEIQTGFLYFFSLGDTAKMKGDILIMEEREATPKKVKEIQSAGKKAIVWTVNTEDSIDKFLRSEVDGMITDYVKKVKKAMKKRDERTDLDIILDSFFQ